MTVDLRPISDLLEDMALKIMMVEPGNLAVVGELISLIEGLVETAEVEGAATLKKMAVEVEQVLGKIIMTDLEESAENYDLVGKCIAQMQEVHRTGDDSEEAVHKFKEALTSIGHVVSDEAGADEKDEEDKPLAPTSAPPIKEVEDGSEEMPDFLQDVELLTGFIEEAYEHLESIETNVLDLEANPDDREIIDNIFRPFHTIKGVSGFLNLVKTQELAHCTENLLDDVRNGVRGMDSSVIDVVLKVGDFLRVMVENIKLVLDEGPDKYKNYDISEYVAWVKNVQGGAAVTPEAGDISPPPESLVPETSSTMPQERPAQTGSSPAAVVPKKQAAPKASDAAVSQKTKPGVSIKVDVGKLDGLVNAVGELVIMQAMVRANPLITKLSDPKLTKDFAQLGRITSELQKTAMSMRMVPIRQTFQKMIRLVRDLSKKTGKKVDLVMEGEETEIDRNMVDSIYDPLVHMMRNSVDHGVQLPAEREALGKPAKGTVSLRAYQKGGNMVIEIEDDGQGLNTSKIREKAIERNLIADNDNMSSYELNNLIFLPGFSTADKITDVSGRGVGMDVVKRAVERLRGKVEVISEPGNGSQFIIRLPLTLAIIDGIIVRVGAERYIIPTTAIQESMRPTEEQYNTVHGRGEGLMIRNTLVPIIRLYELFGVEPSNKSPFEGIVVVVEAEGKQRAILVDELLGKQEVVIKNLGGIQEIKGVAGGTILGDGRVGLILDLAGLVSTKTKKESEDEGNLA